MRVLLALFLALGIVHAVNAASLYAAAPIHTPSIGVACDGHTDDFVPMQTAINQGLLVLPGTRAACLTSKPLQVPSSIGGGAIVGVNPYSSTILYTGTGNGPLLIGDGNGPMREWLFQNFRVQVSTLQNSGACVVGTGLMRNNFLNFVIDGEGANSNGNCWNGMSVTGANLINWQVGEVRAVNEALQITGSATLGQSDFSLDNVKIAQGGTPGNVSIHIGGGFGGFVCGNVTMSAAVTNVVIDNAFSATGNRGIFFSDRCFIDSSLGGGILVNDTDGSTNKLIDINGWIAGTGGYGLQVLSWNGSINVRGSTFWNTSTGAINVSDTRTILNFSPGTTFKATNGSSIAVCEGSTCVSGTSLSGSLQGSSSNAPVNP